VRWWWKLRKNENELDSDGRVQQINTMVVKYCIYARKLMRRWRKDIELWAAMVVLSRIMWKRINCGWTEGFWYSIVNQMYMFFIKMVGKKAYHKDKEAIPYTKSSVRISQVKVYHRRIGIVTYGVSKH
jgi:hypothetical protein